MGGQGVLPIPLVYNGWVQNLPAIWKNQLTPEQQNPFPIGNIVVGGEIFGANATALLLAGAVANAYWILPVLIGIAVIPLLMRTKNRN